MKPYNGNIPKFLCYRIGFGGNPVHLITMAHVLERISIEISMHPGVVSTCLVDEVMNKKWRSQERGKLLKIQLLKINI